MEGESSTGRERHGAEAAGMPQLSVTMGRRERGVWRGESKSCRAQWTSGLDPKGKGY